MSTKTDKNDSWDDLSDSQKEQIQKEVKESNKKKKTTWDDVKENLSKLK
ncbi:MULTISPECIES: hypothetical protein [Tenacibaculum]|nr:MULTISPECIES: hypothetical protein [Tenacibaculum]MCH3883216.1 hypothetical protein [Tenacibaculum aquimarinum]MCH3885401.1 hypothetical protein [Tenacibaculum aquimarinum]MDO6600939.1 hypothetical protein [Tenacibaculum sp. 1_MG-2023]